MRRSARRRRLSRRGFLTGALGLGGAGMLSLLAACRMPGAPPSPGAPTPSAGSGPVPTPVAPSTPSAVPTAGPAVAKPFGGRTVAIQLWPGPFADLVRGLVQPDFERAHGAKLVVEEASPAEQIGRLRAERDDPRHVVMGLDDLTVSMAREEGLIAPLDPRGIPNLADVHPEYVLADGFGVAQGVSWVTVWYNSQKVKAAPTSYEAFWDPQFKGRVAVPSVTLPSGLQWLIVAATLGTGKSLQEAQLDVEHGFEKWKQLKPNLHSTFDSFSTSARLLAQGEIWLSFGPSRQADYFILKGAPVERAAVREGAFLGSNALALVKHPTLEPLGRDLIDRMLAPEVQLELAQSSNLGPSNARTPCPAELARLMPVGADEARRMILLDWGHVNRHRTAWVERWNWEVGG